MVSEDSLLLDFFLRTPEPDFFILRGMVPVFLARIMRKNKTKTLYFISIDSDLEMVKRLILKSLVCKTGIQG